MKKLTKSQKLNFFSIACLLFASILDFIEKNYVLGFVFLMSALTFIFLDYSEKKKK